MVDLFTAAIRTLWGRAEGSVIGWEERSSDHSLWFTDTIHRLLRPKYPLDELLQSVGVTYVAEQL